MSRVVCHLPKIFMFRTNLFNIMKGINICLVRDLCIILSNLQFALPTCFPAHQSPGKHPLPIPLTITITADLQKFVLTSLHKAAWPHKVLIFEGSYLI
jgi:hypothetical protein